MTMYFGLDKKARLWKEKECVVLFSVEDTGRLRYIHPIYALLLALCNGRRTGEDLQQVLIEAFDFSAERAAEMFAKAVSDFTDFLIVSPGPFPGAERYDPLDFLYKPAGDPNLRRLSAPVAIAWLVTERCPFDCVYCCIQTLPAAERANGELTPEETRAFLEDCVATGVQAFTFHGGEPFLRRDLPELIGYLVRHGVAVKASTKLALPADVVRRLAEAGLEEMQVSIDTPDAAAADRLVGRRRYLAGALRNVELLRRHGIEPKVNTVVTSRNVRDVPQLIRLVAARGVRKVTLSGYLRSFWKHADDLFPGLDELFAMAEAVTDLQAELPGVEVDLPPLEDPRDLSLGQEGFSACSGGRSGLVVGADGRVSICDRLLPFAGAVVGQVPGSPLREIWNGERLRAFVVPEETAFTGTQCASCGLREQCDWRIRCYYRSQMIDRRLFGPDYLCPVAPPPPLRFF
jgi:radical SAM protein with 4Fe4S-binding SPASM domain